MQYAHDLQHENEQCQQDEDDDDGIDPSCPTEGGAEPDEEGEEGQNHHVSPEEDGEEPVEGHRAEEVVCRCHVGMMAVVVEYPHP